MARGRQQKWICKDCRGEFSVQGSAPKFCCSCGSENIGRAPSYDLALNFEQKRKELDEICERLNPVYREYAELRGRYEAVMAYWKQQKRRGFVSTEEYDELAAKYEGKREKNEQ